MIVRFVKENKTIEVEEGTSVLSAALSAGIPVNAVCGGKGTCGKCRALINGEEILMCRTAVHGDCEVVTETASGDLILSEGKESRVIPDRKDRYTAAIDIGTTTVVCYLLSGETGEVLSSASMLNPQISFGADVISRIQYVLEHKDDALSSCIRKALSELLSEASKKAGIDPSEITKAAVCGNTAMHHLFLGIDPKPMTVPPYMPKVSEAMELPAKDLLPVSGEGRVRILPNIAGFVGADTVACMLSTGLAETEDLTLLIDIGTNGEMVLGNKYRRIACSTAAGPAFEGAKISAGMRGAEGAINHVTLADGTLKAEVIGGGEAKGICGSGLIDLISCLLSLSVIDENGYMEEKTYRIPGTEVTLTQRDVREVQVAKAAIAAGIELLTEKYGVAVTEIQKVILAGAFGTFLDPDSVCGIGLIPKELKDRIEPVGNAAGEGAKMCALSTEAYEKSKRIARETEFLELASFPDFQEVFIDCLEF